MVSRTIYKITKIFFLKLKFWTCYKSMQSCQNIFIFKICNLNSLSTCFIFCSIRKYNVSIL